MKYSPEEVIQFVQEEDVKFIRLAFCDVYGKQKNITIMPSQLQRAFTYGVAFDASAIAGFGGEVRSDLFLHPDPATLISLPWRPENGRVVRMFCDVTHPDGTPLDSDTRGLLKKAVAQAAQEGYAFAFGSEMEFYLFQTDEAGNPTTQPYDQAGYMDVAPEDKGENIRREICMILEQMGIQPEGSHHEEGPGQNEIDFRYSDPLTAADNAVTFCSIVKTVAAHNGLWADFSPKPLSNRAGSGLHINLSLYMDGRNLFEGDIAPDSIAGSFMAGVLAHSRELTVFTNPLPNSYQRFGCDEAPRYVSWSRQNRSQLVRIPQVKGDNCRMELRSPDPACNPYLAIGLVLAAGLDGIENRMVLSAPVNKNLFDPSMAEGLGLETLPASLEEAVQAAEESEFLRRVLPEQLASRYFTEELKRCEALKHASDPVEYERTHYFNAI